MENSTAVRDQLTKSLEREVIEFEIFKQLLIEEQEALVAGEVSQLSDITEKKTIAFDNLNILSNNRMNLIKALGFNSDQSGIDQWQNSADIETVNLWNSLLNLGIEIQKSNNLNSKLINIRLQYTQQTMSTLLAAINQTELYGPSGQRDGVPQSSNMRGIIGKA